MGMNMTLAAVAIGMVGCLLPMGLMMGFGGKLFGRRPAAAQGSAETERIRRIFKKQAPKYDRSMGRFERLLFAGNREWACGQAQGDVLEIAAGTGRNLPHYPPDVRLTDIELSLEMAELGRQRAKELGREIDLRVGDAQDLDLPDASIDTVVCTYGLCTIPDDRAAVREAKPSIAARRQVCPRRARPQPEPGGSWSAALDRSPVDPLRRRSPHARAARAPRGRGLRDRAGKALEGRNRRACRSAKALAGTSGLSVAAGRRVEADARRLAFQRHGRSLHPLAVLCAQPALGFSGDQEIVASLPGC